MTLTPKERMAIGRVTMPEQDPAVRATNFEEVNLGLTEELAILPHVPQGLLR
jgi:glutamate synthase (NADPH) small chain